MPHECRNKVIITHTNSSKVEDAVDAFRHQNLHNYFIPVPSVTESCSVISAFALAAKLQEQKMNKVKTAKSKEKGWRDFRFEHWGCRFDVGDPNIGTDSVETMKFKLDDGTEMMQASFEYFTDWYPPIGVYRAMYNAGFEVTAYYFEPLEGMGGIFRNGRDTRKKLEIEKFAAGNNGNGQRFGPRNARDYFGSELDDHLHVGQYYED